jgi:hypothetical protein
LTSAAGAASALLIVESHRRHVPENYSLQTANVYSHFHRRSNTENINAIDDLNQRMLIVPVKIDSNVPEKPLSLELIIRLRRELFAM